MKQKKFAPKQWSSQGVEEYYNSCAHDYSKENYPRNDWEALQKMMDRFALSLPSKKVLDVGCGPGVESRYLWEKGLSITGIDLSPRFIAAARKNVPGATFKRMDMLALGFSNHSFGGLFVCKSFFHLPKSFGKNALEEFYRVLIPGGILFLLVVEGSGSSSHFSKQHGKDYFVRYRRKELKRQLHACGFVNIAIARAPITKNQRQWLQVWGSKPLKEKNP